MHLSGVYKTVDGANVNVVCFVSQEIYLASLGGDGKVKDNVYRMMFAVMTNEVGRTFNWSGKHGWMVGGGGMLTPEEESFRAQTCVVL